MRRALMGLYTYAEFFAQAVFFLPLMGIARLRHRGDPTQRIPGRWMRRFGRSAARGTPIWKFSVEGDAPKDIATCAYVVVANHESTADPFLLSFLPWDMRWIAKEALFKLPLIGWLMHFSGDIPLRRGDRESVTEMMGASKNALAGGISIMMFPEGTRTATGELGPFKDGAFALAIEAQVPLLPVAIAGTRTCRPKGSLWFGEARAVAKVLAPIPTAGLGLDDLARVREEARRRIAAELPEMRTRTGIVASSETESTARSLTA